jgi:hypothetical protein
MTLISGSKGFPVKRHVCAGLLSISKQSFFCLSKNRNIQAMSAAPSFAQKQLLYLISKLQESLSHVFSVCLCANTRLSSLLFKKALDFFICPRCRSLLKTEPDTRMSVLSVSLWINIFSFKIQAELGLDLFVCLY